MRPEAKPAADVLVRRWFAARPSSGSPSRHRAVVRRGLCLGRQHARHRSAAGAAGGQLRRHGGRGLDRRHRVPVRQRRVRAGARPVRRPLRQDAGGGHRLPRRRAVLRLERAVGVARHADIGTVFDRGYQLRDHSARHCLGGRQCRLRAPPGHARPLPERPDAGPDDGRRAGRRHRRLAGLALGLLGAGDDLHRGRRRAVRRHARAARHRARRTSAPRAR